MKHQILYLSSAIIAICSFNAPAAVRYVNLNNSSPSPPYTSWSTAATSIQDAINAASAGDQILVTNGVYQTGGQLLPGIGLSNRVAITKAVTVQSVNGPSVTVIQGSQVAGTTNGSSAVRCVYLAAGAALSGFTVTNGATLATTSDGSAGGVYCFSTNSVVSNCVIIGNAANFQGGGVFGGKLNNCTLSGNSASDSGGAAWGSILTGCVIASNSATVGGGAESSTLTNCVLEANIASGTGGAVYSCDLRNCALIANAAGTGGAAEYSTLTNCTLVGNSAPEGGGADACTLNNCIVYYNSAATGANYSDNCTLTYCCTTPVPASGTNNFTFAPQLASLSHLSASSPCRGAGKTALGVDIDGQPWLNPPSIGCDEYMAGGATGPFTLSIQAPYTNAATSFQLDFVARISGNVSASRWEFGDGTIVSNLPVASHAWAAGGTYPVVLRAYNDTFPSGLSATSLVHVAANPVQYVLPSNANPTAPFTSWATAATNIQDAIDAGFVGGTILVSNGTYQAGGRFLGEEFNRVATTRTMLLRSVNGPGSTIIDGAHVARCAYLANGSVLSGFTLANGASIGLGGGLRGESLGAVASNCVFTSNFSLADGGGAQGATLINCTLSGNSAADEGGGADRAVLKGCILTGNWATNFGGGVSGCTLTNCTLTGNWTPGQGGGAQGWDGLPCDLHQCTLSCNWAADSGGGANGARLDNCFLFSNSATNQGGGAQSCNLNRCLLMGNSAGGYGGGAILCNVTNCAVTGNSAGVSGGGVNSCTLYNCTLTGNSAAGSGGADSCTLYNSIIYYNTASRQPNYSRNCLLTNCCTTPLMAGGANNIESEPRLATDSHLSTGSPCLGAGSASFATGLDLDGEAWANLPAIGCDELHSGAATGALSINILNSATNVAAGARVDFAAQVIGRATASLWEFGDGIILSNRPYASHSWAVPGVYPVVLRVYNDSNASGVTATQLVHVIAQPVYYVAVTSANPLAPYNSWATAATNIQDAVEAATAGALVLVSNGTYQTGGRLIYGALTNRLAITNGVNVQGFNGPSVTIIQGTPTNGDSAVRCVHLGNGSVLSGFTLTLGATRNDGDPDSERSGGAVWCQSWSAVVSNCVLINNSANLGGGGVIGGTILSSSISSNSAGGEGGGADSCVLKDCTLSGNFGPDWWGSGGGGACFSTLNNCGLSGNGAYYGGGASYSSLTACNLSGNSAGDAGGGAGASILTLCTVSSNWGWGGGGADGSLLERCSVHDNSANYGGGAQGSTANNSAFWANSVKLQAGAAQNCTLNNCTLTGNSAGSIAGGVSGGALNNCIVYFNSAPVDSNYSGSALNYCCAAPLPTNGFGNIASDPFLASSSHLSAASPCRGAGSAAFVSGFDIDGEAWANPPSIGCDEFRSVTGALSVTISASFTNATPGIPLDFIGTITGSPAASRWEFGDGSILSNKPYASHSWTSLGDYSVELRAYNDSFPAGVSATVTVHIVTQPIHYVAAVSTNPVAPYTSWITAATNIQDAVDVVNAAGALVLVSNGVYGGTVRWVNNDVPHRLVVAKPIVVRSLNGPSVTVIQGQPYDGDYSAIRCVYLGVGASLLGFTLTNGAAMPLWAERSTEDRTAGGVWCDSSTALVSNCVIVACSAGFAGGGAYGGTIKNSSFLYNAASIEGGGAYLSTLNDCLLLTNTAIFSGYGSGGAGAYASTLSRCYLAGNVSDTAGGGAGVSVLQNCTLIGNVAPTGGAVDQCSLANCAVTGNSASANGGGASASMLINCTVTGNAATNSGGGVFGCTNFNSLVYYNSASSGSNWVGSSFTSSDTAPLPSNPGNIATEPLLADSFHLSAGSPCKGAGNPQYVSGTDIDSESWFNPPAIGCDEYHSGSITGALAVAIQTPYTNVAAGYPLRFTAIISGHASAMRWDFGDGIVVSNRPHTLHSWAAPGDHSIELRVYNDSVPAGVSTGLTVHVQEAIHYVALDNLAPVSPYLSWATAATNIQDAVDATFAGGTILVSNGTYQAGGGVASGLLSNRVAVTRPLVLRSVNGPAVTVIQGYSPTGNSAVRCVSLARDCVLSGFTLSNGGTRSNGDGDLDQSGAGLWCDSVSAIVSNCVISGNYALNSGGGAQRGTLYNCVLSGNNAGGAGGAASSVLYFCTITNNTAGGSGGAAGCTMNNCLIQGNSASEAGGVSGCTLTNCVIKGNHATRYAGGSEASTMFNCVVSGNSAHDGGGIYNDWMYNCTIVGNSAIAYGGGVLIASLLNNCIITDNSAPNGPNYWSDNLSYCCTMPYYSSGLGNITNVPQFVDPANGNFRLQSTSPCINSGFNGYAPTGPDPDGNPRIAAGTVDIGAYEFQPGGAGSFADWLQQYGLPTDGSANFADSDGDGMNNWQEWIAGTVPTNAASFLRFVGASHSASGVTLTWQSVSNRAYLLERGTNLAGHPPFALLATNIQGQPGLTTYTDTTAIGPGPFFYRIGVQAGSNQLGFSIISFAWLQQYGLPTDGSADFADPDGDHMNNWQEWIAGTDPTNAASALRMLTPARTGSVVSVSWQSVNNRTYFLQRATNLTAPPVFSTVATNLKGLAGTTVYMDTNAPAPSFYRVGIQQ